MHRALLSVLLAATLVTACSGDGSDTDSDDGNDAADSTTSSTSTPRSSTSISTVPSTPPTTSGGIEPVRRAVALCESLTGDPARATVLSAAPSVAGAVAAELASASASTDPWDALEVDQFVAVCTFAASSSAGEQPPPTIACPDGAIVLDVEVEAVYADEDGRVSDASAVHEADPCVEPPPLP